MINSITYYEDKQKNAFGAVTNSVKPSDYWLPKEDKVEIHNSGKLKNYANKSLGGIKIITPDEARKTHDIKTIGLSIAGVVVLSGATIFFLMKGGTKGLTNNFRRASNYLNKKLLSSKLNNEEQRSQIQLLYAHLYKIFDSLAQKSEAVNNLTSFKDALFKKVMSINKPLLRIHNKITGIFERLGRRTVINSYSNTASRLAETRKLTDLYKKDISVEDLSEVISIGKEKKTRAEWLKLAEDATEDFEQIYKNNFSRSQQTSRYKKIKQSAESLKARFADMKTFLTKELFYKFLAESSIVKNKEMIKKGVKSARKNLSYNREYLEKEAENIVLKIISYVPFKNSNNIAQIRNMNKQLTSYIAENLDSPAEKTKILEFIKDVKTSVSTSKQIKDQEALLKNFEELEQILNDYKKGKAEQILEIYEHILPKSKYEILSKAYKSTIEKLDKSINLETEEFVSKIRDLVIGSAPTDVLTVIGSLGTLGYQLCKSDDSEERNSILLKYGFPAISGIAVSLYCNAKLFAGTKSLACAIGSTIILNRLGILGDDLLKKYMHKKNNSQDEKPLILASEEKVNLKNPPKTV